MNRLIHMAAYAVVAAALGLVVVVVYWRNAPIHAIEVNNDLSVRPAEAKPDDIVFVSFDYCKTVNSAGTVERSLVGGKAQIDLPTQNDTSKKGCNNVEAPVVIPTNTPTGTYFVRYKLTYKVNPVRTVIDTYDSKSFMVTRPPEAVKTDVQVELVPVAPKISQPTPMPTTSAVQPSSPAAPEPQPSSPPPSPPPSLILNQHAVLVNKRTPRRRFLCVNRTDLNDQPNSLSPSLERQTPAITAGVGGVLVREPRSRSLTRKLVCADG